MCVVAAALSLFLLLVACGISNAADMNYSPTSQHANRHGLVIVARSVGHAIFLTILPSAANGKVKKFSAHAVTLILAIQLAR